MRRTGLLIIALLLGTAMGLAQEANDELMLQTSPRTNRPFVECVDTYQPTFAIQSPWQQLDRMPATDRANSLIALDISAESPAAAHAIAREVASLWNAGDFTAAIRRMHDLMRIIEPPDVELGFQWKSPIVSSQNLIVGLNSRIGTVDSATSLSLAANSDASRLYCVVSQSGDGLSGGWNLFLSTDKGATWANTYTQSGTGNAPKNALMVTDSTTYVVYLPYFTLQRLRLKPFHTSDGSPGTVKGGASYRDVRTLTGVETFREVAACAGRSGSIDVLNLVVSTSSRQARYFSTVWPSDTTWSELVDPAATAVSGGLSIAFGSTLSRAGCYIAYVDTNGNACVDTLHTGPGQINRSWSRVNANGITSLGAHGDTVLCAFDQNSGGTQHIKYIINYDGGEGIWRFGAFQDTTLRSETPAVVIEKGQGLGAFYRHYTGSEWLGRFGWRAYPLGNIWSVPAQIADYAPSSIRPAAVALGDQTWGVAYVVADTIPAYRAVMFATHHQVPTAIAAEPLTEPAAFDLTQNFPNPFNPTTVISGQCPVAGHVRIAVYDILGREVAVLMDEGKEPGTFEVTWDAHGFASGVYMCRMAAGAFIQTRRMLLLK
jgi:hypothetical protein